MRKFYWLVSFIVAVMFLLPQQSFSASKVTPAGFNTNGDKISGWYWLRRSGHYAEWKFKFPSQAPRLMAACFSTLSTNKVNGGAGYNSYLKVTVSFENGKKFTKRLRLKNAHPCLKRIYSGFSNGVGYRSYGCMLFKTPPKINIITIKAEYKGRHHSAVKRDSVILYVK
ncbi:hypothetical protein [Hippea sp. KM1]|uniref:hypothetical protein n=1 Tax=Hippea sp. KM1 TaxID=944481 RepID=UPI00046D20F0|nr:hypothetical protein [Hippea sp. KM1]